MANFTNVKTMLSGKNRLVIQVTGLFATSDETDKIVVDKSTLTGPLGVEPSKLRINNITWDVQGFTYVLLEFDRTTDDVIGYFSGQGYDEYGATSGLNDDGSGGTGDLILTTAGGATGATFNLRIDIQLKE